MWKLFDEGKKKETGDSANRKPVASVVMKSFLEEPTQGAEHRPTWWAAEASVYPHLVEVIERRLHIKAMPARTTVCFCYFLLI